MLLVLLCRKQKTVYRALSFRNSADDVGHLILGFSLSIMAILITLIYIFRALYLVTSTPLLFSASQSSKSFIAPLINKGLESASAVIGA